MKCSNPNCKNTRRIFVLFEGELCKECFDTEAYAMKKTMEFVRTDKQKADRSLKNRKDYQEKKKRRLELRKLRVM